MSLGFGLLLEAIVRTGELRPQEPNDPNGLLAIDRPVALRDDAEASSGYLSDIGVAIAGTYAALDITLTALTDRGESPLAYGFLYLESAALNLALQNLVKIAVRRPRPTAYRELRQTGMVSTKTNSALAFYSGHTAVTAGLAAAGPKDVAVAFGDAADSGRLGRSDQEGTSADLACARAIARGRAHRVLGRRIGPSIADLSPHAVRSRHDLAARIRRERW